MVVTDRGMLVLFWLFDWWYNERLTIEWWKDYFKFEEI